MREHGGVERVAPLPGRESGMCGLAREGHGDLGRGVGERVRDAAEPLQRLYSQGKRMCEEACVDAFECAGREQLDLSAAAFFGGSAEEANASRLARVSEVVCCGEEGGDGRGCEEVVAAGVANAGQGIIFGVENDETTVDAVGAFERGAEAVVGSGDGEVVPPE